MSSTSFAIAAIFLTQTLSGIQRSVQIYEQNAISTIIAIISISNIIATATIIVISTIVTVKQNNHNNCNN